MKMPTTEVFLFGTFLTGAVAISVLPAPEGSIGHGEEVESTGDFVSQNVGEMVLARRLPLSKPSVGTPDESALTALTSTQELNLHVVPQVADITASKGKAAVQLDQDDNSVSLATFLQPASETSQPPVTTVTAEVVTQYLPCDSTATNCQRTRARILRRR